MNRTNIPAAFNSRRPNARSPRRYAKHDYPTSWSGKNHTVGRLFIEHALLVADVMMAVELACRNHGGIQLLYEDDLAIRSERQPFQWKVTIKGGMKLGVVPDRVFALEYPDQNGQSQRAYFFLEADRGRHTVSHFVRPAQMGSVIGASC